MILTVTLNAAVDEAVAVDEFVHGGANRCTLDALDAGGKGLNTSRVIKRLGRTTIALGFVGGVTGAMVRARLDEEGVLHAFDDVPGLTRLNVMIYERSSGRRSRLYLPGATVTPDRIDNLKTRLAQAPAGGVVVLGGSLPPGLLDETYRELVGWLAQRNVRSIVDTSGKALAAVLSAAPLLIKPNVEEAEELLGRRIYNDDDAFAAAERLRALGAINVVVSQGADGAVGVGPCGRWKAIAPHVTACSTVGSGDSMVAGLAVAFDEGGTLAEGLRLGTAAGAATATIPGTHLCRPEDVETLLPHVVVRDYTPLEKPFGASPRSTARVTSK
ncbi:MAG: 1-phosphofructokinase [Candidatus Eremiobacteraeota bacterium]|nr:1-phosphofructokinase [Candidatus Eremiobacteraeota bacterium]